MSITAPAPGFFKGLQGRYFIPYLPAALLPFCVRRASEVAKRNAVVAMTFLGTAQSAWVLLQRFWL